MVLQLLFSRAFIWLHLDMEVIYFVSFLLIAFRKYCYLKKLCELNSSNNVSCFRILGLRNTGGTVLLPYPISMNTPLMLNLAIFLENSSCILPDGSFFFFLFISCLPQLLENVACHYRISCFN